VFSSRSDTRIAGGHQGFEGKEDDEDYERQTPFEGDGKVPPRDKR